MSDTLRVWALETRGAVAGAKSRCRFCGNPITWMVTLKNNKLIPVDGHEPVPLYTQIDTETRRTIEIHARATIHFETCRNRPARRPS